MGAMAAKIAGVSIEYSIVNSGADQIKHESPAWLGFVRGIQLWPADSSHKGSVTRENVSIWWRQHDMHNMSGQNGLQMRILLSNCRWLPSEKAESKTATVFSETTQSLYSPSRRASYRQISWATRFGFRFSQSLKNWTSTSAVMLLMCLSIF